MAAMEELPGLLMAGVKAVVARAAAGVLRVVREPRRASRLAAKRNPATAWGDQRWRDL